MSPPPYISLKRHSDDSVSEEGVRFYNKFLCLGLSLGNFVFGTKRCVFGFLAALARLALRVIAVISKEKVKMKSDNDFDR